MFAEVAGLGAAHPPLDVQLPLQLDMCLERATVLKLTELRRKANQPAIYMAQLVGLKGMGDFRHRRHDSSSKLFALCSCSCQTRFAIGVV